LKASGGWTLDNLSFVAAGDDTVVGTGHLTSQEGMPWESNPVVITFRDGKIADMQDCATRREAERFARRH
jgi:ketosteroid isomerase-like protein